jgi:polygalacturonase
MYSRYRHSSRATRSLLAGAAAAALVPACVARSDAPPSDPVASAESAVSIDTTAWYYLVNRSSGLCLDDPNGSKASGVLADQAACAANNNNEQWQFKSVATGVYQLINGTNGFCLDNKGSQVDGANVGQYSNCGSSSNNLRWTVNDLGNGYVQLVSKTSGMCLENPTGSLTPGTAQDQQICAVDGDADDVYMQWQLVGATNPTFPAPVAPLPWSAGNSILSSVVVPTFPNTTCTITSYGAVGDGKTDNTAAFKSAIADCSSKGGGHVVVPSGTFVSGAVQLLSNIDLHLSSGATISFSGDKSKYPLVYTRCQGIELMNESPAIYAYGATNVGLTGQGTLDASGTASFNSPSAINICSTGWGTAQSWGDACTNGPNFVGNCLPIAQRVLPSGQAVRQSFVQFYNSHNVLVRDVTLSNAQFWQMHVVLSSNVTIDGITENVPTASNTDCFDPESSDHVVMKNGNLSCHDDCMALKSGRDNDGRRVNVPLTNVVLMNVSCQTPYGMITAGSEESGDLQNIYAYNITTHGTGARNLIDMRSNYARGGGGTNINIDTVPSATLSGAVVFLETNYTAGSCNTAVGNVTPIWDNINLSNIAISGAPQVLNLSGISTNPTNMTLRNATFTNIGNATNTVSYTNITATNVTINGKSM